MAPRRRRAQSSRDMSAVILPSPDGSYTGAERRRRPRRPSDVQVRIGWRDRVLGNRTVPGRLTEENELGCTAVVVDGPETKAAVCIETDGGQRWAHVRFGGWETGQRRLGLEYDGEALAFVDDLDA